MATSVCVSGGFEEGLDADGRKLKRRPSRGMYVLPSLFTRANIGAG